jgi:multimeric flavodoxin WrbA
MSIKKIVFIQGSPRKSGNTRAISAVAMEAAKKAGAEVSEIDALALEFKAPGCIGCQQCQMSDKYECAINDQLSRTVSTLPKYDVIVFSTPLYWWSLTAQIKMLIDRIYSLVKISESGAISTPLSGKKIALLATAAGQMEDNLDVLDIQVKHPAAMLGCSYVSCLFPDVICEPGTLQNETDAVKKAQEFGKSLAM